MTIHLLRHGRQRLYRATNAPYHMSQKHANSPNPLTRTLAAIFTLTKSPWCVQICPGQADLSLAVVKQRFFRLLALTPPWVERKVSKERTFAGIIDGYFPHKNYA